MNVDTFVSDWNSANGIETFVYSAASKVALILASFTQNALIAACNRVDGNVKKAISFAVSARIYRGKK